MSNSTYHYSQMCAASKKKCSLKKGNTTLSFHHHIEELFIEYYGSRLANCNK